MKSIWKIAPGEHADNWDICREGSCIVVGWEGIGNFKQYEDEGAIFRALKKEYGKRKGCGKGAARSIWRFVREIRPLDVIVANRGESSVVGIGVVHGEYLHPNHPENPVPVPPMGEWWRRNARLINWRIKEEVELHKPNIFVASTVQRLTTYQCAQIRKAYLKRFPKLKATLNDLFDGQVAESDGDSSDAVQSHGATNAASESDIEGLKTEVILLQSKRSQKLRKKALALAKGVCCVCGRDFSKLLSGKGKRVLQVHHTKQLAARTVPSVTKVKDLAVVCANCHTLLHMDPTEALAVDKLRGMLRRDGFGDWPNGEM